MTGTKGLEQGDKKMFHGIKITGKYVRRPLFVLFFFTYL